MAKENKILPLMVAHHGLIEVLVVVFRDSLSDNQKAKETFEDLKWQMEKHFFVEEKINFRFVFPTQEELYALVQHLLEEHDQLLGMASRIELDLKEGKKEIEIDAFVDMLTHHREVEEKVLYPKLDETLSDFQKDMIIRRINEVTIEKE